MITQDLFNKKQKTFMDYAPGKVPSKKMGLPEWVYKNFTTKDKDDPFWVQYGIDLAESGR